MNPTRYRLEQHAVAICLAFSGICFGVGLLLQTAGRAVDRRIDSALRIDRAELARQVRSAQC